MTHQASRDVTMSTRPPNLPQAELCGLPTTTLVRNRKAVGAVPPVGAEDEANGDLRYRIVSVANYKIYAQGE